MPVNPVKLAIPAALAAILLMPALASAALPETDAVARGAAFIRATLRDDGGLQADLAFGPGQTFDAIYALRAAGVDPAGLVSAAGNTPAAFLAARAPELEGALAAKGALAAIALGLDPRAVGGTDLVAALESAFAPATGRHAADDFGQALIVIALVAAGADVPAATLDALRAGQLEDGGWGFGETSTPDATALVAQALIAAGSGAGDDPAVADALAWLSANQLDDGGWGFDGVSNANATAFAVQALLAARLDPESGEYTRAAGVTPVSYLLGQQLEDGSFAGYDPAYAVNQVLPALAGRTFINAVTTPPASAAPDTPAFAAPTTGTGLRAEDGGVPALALALLAAALATGAGGALLLRRRA